MNLMSIVAVQSHWCYDWRHQG